MKSRVHTLFPVVALEFVDFPITDKEISKLIRDQNFVPIMPVDNGLISSQKYLLNLKKNSSLKKNLLYCVKEYTQNVLDIGRSVSFYLQNSWMIKHRPGDWGQTHFHENSLLSGILYLRTPPNSGDLILHRNRNVSTDINPYMSLPQLKPNRYNADSFICQASEKKLILFPANMNHSIRRNESSEDRYSIAFNVFFKGRIGEETRMNVAQI